jgi:hypothetical protein
MDQWLVRTSRNWIAGPYLKEQVRQMIAEGKLTLDDEVCSATGYWFFLHEHDEVRTLLGIEVPVRASRHGDDVTETLTTAGEVTDPNISLEGLADAFDAKSEITSVMTAGTLRELKGVRKKSASSVKNPSKKTKGTAATVAERQRKRSIWIAIAWSFLIFAGLVVALYFWLLYRAHRPK